MTGLAPSANEAQSAPTNRRNFMFMIPRLKRVRTGFTGANTNDLFDFKNEDLAVADFAGVGGFLDGLDHTLDEFGFHRDFNFHFGQKVDDVFGTAVELGVAFLTSEAFDFGHGDALHPNACEGFTHLVELEGFNNGANEFHEAFPGFRLERFGVFDERVRRRLALELLSRWRVETLVGVRCGYATGEHETVAEVVREFNFAVRV